MTPTEAKLILDELSTILPAVAEILLPGPAARVVTLALEAAVRAVEEVAKNAADPEPDFAAKLQASVNADVAAKVAEGWK